jgi:hypothetical protein
MVAQLISADPSRTLRETMNHMFLLQRKLIVTILCQEINTKREEEHEKKKGGEGTKRHIWNAFLDLGTKLDASDKFRAPAIMLCNRTHYTL